MISLQKQAIALLNALDEAAFIISHDHTILQTNSRALAEIQKTHDDVSGKPYYQIVYGLDSHHPDCPLPKSRTSKTVETAEIEKKSSDILAVKSSPVFDVSGNILFFLFSFRRIRNQDITADLEYEFRKTIWEREKLYHDALRQLAEKDKLINSIYKALPTGVGIIKNRVFVLVNEHFCNLTGYTHDEIVGRSSRFLYLSDEDFNKVGLKIYREVSKKDIGKIESAWKTKDNRIINVLIQISYLNKEDNAYIFSTMDITDRKNYEKRLLESETRYKSIFEESSMPMLIIDPVNGRLFDVNKASLAYYGYTKEQMLAMSITDINTLSLEQIVKEMREARQQKKFLFYFKHKIASGEIRDVEVHSGPVIINGRSYLFSIIQDISIQKRQEEELQVLTSSLLKAQEIAHLGSWELDMESGKMVWSEELYKIYGYEPHSFEPTVNSFFESVHSDEKDHIISVFDSFFRQEGRYTVETSIIRPDGELVYVLFGGESAVKNGRKVFTGTILDITDRKKAEIGIEERNLFFNSVISNLQEGVVVYDKELRIILWNKKMERMTGKSATEVIGRNIYKLFPHFRNEGLDVLMRRAYEGEVVVSHDILYNNDQGQSIWYFATYSPNFSWDGKITGIIEVVTDISDRKKAEFKEKEKNEELFKANAELDNFVYRVSHDLRAPITSSLGLARISLNENSIDVLHHYARLQEKSLVKLDTFIKDILDYSRNARMEVTPELVSIHEIVENVLEHLNKLPENNQIDLRLAIRQEHDFYSDKLRMEIVLNNLISNAFKFRNPYKQDAFVKILCTVDEDKGIFVIEDNGIGIAPEHQGKVFEMFYRATASKPGSGIGLYIVQDCIKKMGGEITLESTVNEGSRFTIVLPNLKKPQDE